MPKFESQNAVDDDVTTRWVVDYDIKESWLEVDLGKPTEFNYVKMWEGDQFAHVCEFELQYKKGETWHTFLRGETIGKDYSKKFDSVTARYVRLNILDHMGRPAPTSIWEFQLFKR